MSDDDYLFDKSGEADPEIAKLEKVLGASRYVSPEKNRADRIVARAPAPPRTLRQKLRRVAPFALAAAILFGLGIRAWPPPAGPSLEVTRVQGVTRVDTRTFSSRGRLGVGAWLETDPGSRAVIEMQQIGTVTVGPGSRVRLVAVSPTEQRLQLERGVIEAHVRAMPRLFVVDTPSARATDLGCAYRLEVTTDGGTLLHVTSGAVELAGEGRQAHVPATAMCETRPRRGPGCPYFDDASEDFKKALRSIDFEPEPGAGTPALGTLLALARVRDTLTLWQLVFRLDPERRNRVLARVMELVPVPAEIDLKSGDPAAFQRYQDNLVTHW